MEEVIEIRYTLRSENDKKKFETVKEFLKLNANTKVIAFLITEKYQEIQKLK
ncbi:MAG: hypothetical protein ACFFAO_20760 [Candidatus Hermodarchaeota archaeon]